MKKLGPLTFTSFFLAFVIFLNFFVPTLAQSDKCANPAALDLVDIQSCLDNLSRARDLSVAATAGVQKQVDGIKARVTFIENDLAVKQKNISDGYIKLEKQTQILNNAIRAYYIDTYKNSPILIFLSAESATQITQLLAYQQATTNRDKAIITNIASTIQTLQILKEQLEGEKVELAAVKTKLDKVVAESKAYQATLSSQIASLSARQQQILAQRLASLNIPRSAGTSVRGCIDDRHLDPGFSPRLAFFTYGAPHRNGLNQYGAFARAKAEQPTEQILEAYYPGKTLKTDYDQGVQITTTTGWSGPIEDYVKRIYEVPNTWGDEGGMATLKAQAVAARTYALNVTSNGSKPICTTEQCQVFKPDPKGGNWDAAVEATRGWVLMDGGSPAFTQYASTHGGYIQNLGKFDGRDSQPTSFSELNDRAYDKDSPWFYCDWGARGQNNTAWLRPEEVVDIANVAMLAQEANNDSAVTSHLYQTDRPNPAGTDTWDPGRVKQELQNRGKTPLSSVSSVNISADFGSGKTSSITINGDSGSVSFSGEFFKSYFNLRAPVNIQIVGPLYNIERN